MHPYIHNARTHSPVIMPEKLCESVKGHPPTKNLVCWQCDMCREIHIHSYKYADQLNYILYPLFTLTTLHFTSPHYTKPRHATPNYITPRTWSSLKQLKHPPSTTMHSAPSTARYVCSPSKRKDTLVGTSGVCVYICVCA
jgi:hypothetical protein